MEEEVCHICGDDFVTGECSFCGMDYCSECEGKVVSEHPCCSYCESEIKNKLD